MCHLILCMQIYESIVNFSCFTTFDCPNHIKNFCSDESSNLPLKIACTFFITSCIGTRTPGLRLKRSAVIKAGKRCKILANLLTITAFFVLPANQIPKLQLGSFNALNCLQYLLSSHSCIIMLLPCNFWYQCVR